MTSLFKQNQCLFSLSKLAIEDPFAIPITPTYRLGFWRARTSLESYQATPRPLENDAGGSEIDTLSATARRWIWSGTGGKNRTQQANLPPPAGPLKLLAWTLTETLAMSCPLRWDLSSPLQHSCALFGFVCYRVSTQPHPHPLCLTASLFTPFCVYHSFQG